MENLDFLKCYYRPSFFRMKVDVPVKFDDLKVIPDAAFALYFHEYVHFIQDISTIYGLVNISTITFYIHESAHRIGKLEEKEFETPISLINRDNDYGYNNFLLKPHYMGTSINPKRKRIEIRKYEKEKKQWGTKKSDLLDIVKVDATDKDTDEEFNFYLGGNHITEGMAYLCEQYVYSEILKKQDIYFPVEDYPYLVVQQIAKLIYPELLEEPLIMVAICDACLMTYHPGLSFIRLVEHLEEIKFMQKEMELKQLYQEAETLLKGGHVEFEVILETVRTQIKQNFKSDHFEGNNQWIDLLFDRIKSFRKEIPEFITDFLQFGDLKTNQFFGYFHLLMGSPLVISGDNSGTISLPVNFTDKNFHPGLFWAINQMMRVFADQNPVPCEMKEFCIKSKKKDPKIVVDERCDKAPWTRCSDKDLCPFAIMWRHWALCGFEPIKANMPT